MTFGIRRWEKKLGRLEDVLAVVIINGIHWSYSFPVDHYYLVHNDSNNRRYSIKDASIPGIRP